MGKSGSAAVKPFDIPKALVWQAYYYGRFYRSRLYPLLQRINTYLMRWAGKKIQAAAQLSPVSRVVARDRQTRPRAVRTLAMGAHVRVRRIAMRRAE